MIVDYLVAIRGGGSKTLVLIRAYATGKYTL